MGLILCLLVLLLARVWMPAAGQGAGRQDASSRPGAAQRSGRRLPPSDPAFLADLARVALSSGASLPAALEAVSFAVAEEYAHLDVGTTAQLLLLGAPWAEAWDGIHPRAELLREALQPAWENGVAPLTLLGTAARSYRRRRSREARRAAAELGNSLVVPLGVCFLPAFILVGIVPAVAGATIGLFQ
ncbi:type II secretion system F family protein [Actinotignum sanguinis]|uniref:Type II secretion system F family protein n=2 Tax=Actinomycetaceae TaxID=2049 RepID=A0ABZ0RC58_9ACTO|nr:type II secretion system F family protein [Actinotignum sanguinis]WPJ88562.1 type II secretion system F family protein [Schaalia turicensis]MDE1655705.1 type II secretion system F family protein [Actinotignum sanguinis]MDK7198037.1 type II secretion system F family protein [Actinotignum sanguinis]MDK8512904.1 type II secretion system F family protein [Actinotignum sanguinis]MDK8518427.1 type II secretion system F family protein [Actinotignum sanguinis]